LLPDTPRTADLYLLARAPTPDKQSSLLYSIEKATYSEPFTQRIITLLHDGKLHLKRYPSLSVMSVMASYTTNSNSTSQMMIASDYDCYKATIIHPQQDTLAMQKHSTYSNNDTTGLHYEGMWKNTLRIATAVNAPNPPTIYPMESYTHCPPPNNPGRISR
jgi:hypothetical protein